MRTPNAGHEIRQGNHCWPDIITIPIVWAETFYIPPASIIRHLVHTKLVILFQLYVEDMMKFVSFIFISLLVLAASGCNLLAATTAPSPTPSAAPTLAFNQPTAAVLTTPTTNQTPGAVSTPQASQSSPQVILDEAYIITRALADKEMSVLAEYVSPQRGLRFSPYAAVRDNDLVFSADSLAGLMADTTTYLWGAYDGSGAPIDLQFSDYYAKFIYDEDYANAPQVSLNYRMGVSTTLDNSAEYYPGAMVVEFHFPGLDAGQAGMDWRSLRLVFVQEGSDWYLASIIHDNWTT